MAARRDPRVGLPVSEPRRDGPLCRDERGRHRHDAALWGGRFAGGPARRSRGCRSACSSTGGWRRTTWPPRGRTPGCCAAAGLLDADELGRMLAALDDLEAACATARSVRPSRTRTCTPRSSAVWSSGSAPLGGKLRAGRSRNDQVATDLRLYLRDARPAGRRAAWSSWQTRSSTGRAARRHARARHHAPAARPAGAARPPAAGPRAGRCCATWSGCATGTRARPCLPLGAGALAGSSLPLDPAAVAEELGFTAPLRQLDRRGLRPRLRGRVPVRAPRCSASTCRGSARRSCCGRPRSSAGSSSTTLRHRVVDHAAEEEPRHRRAGPRQGGPADRRPDRRCSPCSRACRWPTTATCRRTRSRCSTRSTR